MKEVKLFDDAANEIITTETESGTKLVELAEILNNKNYTTSTGGPITAPVVSKYACDVLGLRRVSAYNRSKKRVVKAQFNSVDRVMAWVIKDDYENNNMSYGELAEKYSALGLVTATGKELTAKNVGNIIGRQAHGRRPKNLDKVIQDLNKKSSPKSTPKTSVSLTRIQVDDVSCDVDDVIMAVSNTDLEPKYKKFVIRNLRETAN